ncbi:MAG: Gfo/Idh/MocA family oxidoreductase [Acidobacteria bacterium]|nr:Gfo/Idh/MocA family oxidoreductase [Acidobacteriota bacterium]
MKIGLAFIGAGSVIEGRHLPALAAVSGFVVRSVYDPDKQAAGRVAAAAGARVAATLEEAVRGDDVQAVTVASPNVFHRAGVEAAAAAGKHILCEKPIATNLRDARAILQAAERAGIVLQIGFHHRFTTEYRLTRRLLEAGVVGKIRAFQTMLAEPISLVPGGDNYRLKPELSGGLTLIDFGSHRIDQMRGLLGEVAQISAQFASVVPGHGMDDNVTLEVETREGALGTLSFQRFSRGAITPTTLLGEKGVLCFSSYVVNPVQASPVAAFTEEPLPQDALAFSRPLDWWNPPQPGWTTFWPPVENPYAAEYAAFLASIRDKTPPAVTGFDGYQALEIVIGAYKAFAARHAVTLPLDPEEEIPIPKF